ncbi:MULTISPECIES: MmcQ/YjbR family DNA-binding protein [Enterococcus]|uniref:MmcQ/YjbR family DNA-binding protein n=1 Tax=Enterococcus alishanensis TaxID=1303817 RepID=A0ABS6T8G7_9ENTE|nr:MmcQ/YjbR family DNA-binding protein [Enterococcus alishanensis]MBV7389158.1 MmcQ/YjbR family DNA-binding protein [Enterococcus alishanensis]
MDNISIQKRIDHFQAYGNQLKGAKVYFREDWGTIYFDLLGKQFGMMSPEASPEALITLKNLPEKNEELRELYPGMIIPGYYANKKHWNSIKLAVEEISDSEIEAMIARSYDLVLKKLTKKQQAEILE